MWVPGCLILFRILLQWQCLVHSRPGLRLRICHRMSWKYRCRSFLQHLVLQNRILKCCRTRDFYFQLLVDRGFCDSIFTDKIDIKEAEILTICTEVCCFRSEFYRSFSSGWDKRGAGCFFSGGVVSNGFDFAGFIWNFPEFCNIFFGFFLPALFPLTRSSILSASE